MGTVLLQKRCQGRPLGHLVAIMFTGLAGGEGTRHGGKVQELLTRQETGEQTGGLRYGMATNNEDGVFQVRRQFPTEPDHHLGSI